MVVADARREILAGITTFVTMAYIIVVNPAILAGAGIPAGPSMTATIIAAAFGTLAMALWARRPFAIAPYMGENAFIAFTVVKAMGLPWQTALGAVFVAGAGFTLLTLFRVRAWMANAIPHSLKLSLSAGIGLFIAFIGLNACGLVTLGVPGAPVALGALTRPQALLAIAGLMVTATLMIRRVPGAILLGMLAVTLASMLCGLTPLPDRIVALPPDPAPLFGALDIAGALGPKALPVALVIFVMAFVDTIGTLIGLSSRAGLLDQAGNLPAIERPMLADALSNLVAPLVGTTTSGVFIESAAGIEAGGRTGVTALVVAALFLASLFFAPILTLVPPHAYGVALILVGSTMLAPLAKLDFGDASEAIPAFLCIGLTSFSYNVGVGMTAGLISYPVLKLLSGRHAETNLPMWLLAGLSLTFYLAYPFGN
jgi:AGZA family xanthine/uracil permease-like MFS transporter